MIKNRLFAGLFSKKRSKALRKILAKVIVFYTVFSFLAVNVAFCQEITPDGKTATSLIVTGNVTDITTATIQGNNALNSFNSFSIDQGNVVNLQIPTNALNLLNLVHEKQTNINGILNSIKEGKIGGNIFFLNPHGIVVGGNGVLNVGSLTALTPTKQFMDNLFTSSTAIEMVLNGTAPINETGLISIAGKVNTMQELKISAGTIKNNGLLNTGAVFGYTQPDFSDVVNTKNVESGTIVVTNNGNVEIKAAKDFENSGTIKTEGANGFAAGNIAVLGRNIKLSNGSCFSSWGYNGATGGDITFIAKQDRGDIAKISLTGATIKGKDISLNASGFLDDSNILGISLKKNAGGEIDLDSAFLTTTGNLKLKADSFLKINNNMSGIDKSQDGDGSFAITEANSIAKVRVHGNSVLDIAGEIKLSAENNVQVTSKADAATEEGANAFGGSVALNKIVSDTQALIEENAEIKNSSALKLAAVSTNNVETKAIAAPKGINKLKENKISKKYLDQYKNDAQTKEGEIDVAASLAINDFSNITKATLASNKEAKSSGKVEVMTKALNISKVTADGESVQDGSGIGAAVGINKAKSENMASISQNIKAKEIVVEAKNSSEKIRSQFNTMVTSGAGAKDVGVAGALGINIINNSTIAQIGEGAQVNAQGNDLTLTAEHASNSSVQALPTGKGSRDIGVGASVAINTVTNNVNASIEKNASLQNIKNLTLEANSDNDTETKAQVGAVGGKAFDASVALAVLNQNTNANLASGSALNTTGDIKISSNSKGKNIASSKGDSKGDLAIGASVASIVSNQDSDSNYAASAKVDRDIKSDGQIQILATSEKSYEITASASSKGAKKENKDEKIKGKTASEQTLKDNEEAQQGTKNGTKVEVAAAVSASVIADHVQAVITGGTDSNAARKIEAKGKLELKATNSLDSTSQANGATAIKPAADIAIGVGVGLNINKNNTTAAIGKNTIITKAGDITINAESKQNVSEEFKNKLAAEAVSGASANKIGVAGSLAVAYSTANTQAYLGANNQINQAGLVDIKADNKSKLSAKAWSGTLSKQGGDAGVGASVATIYSQNKYNAYVGDDSKLGNLSGLSISAVNNKLAGSVPIKMRNFHFNDLNLQLLLGENNYYTEAIAGSLGSEDNVSGAFAVNIFNDQTFAYLGEGTSMLNATDKVGAVKIKSSNDTTAKTLTGSVAGNKDVGIGVSSADIWNSNQIRSYLGNNSTINQTEGIEVLATGGLDLGIFGVSASLGKTAGVNGIVNLLRTENEVKATIGDGVQIKKMDNNSNNIEVQAENNLKAFNIIGNAAGGSTAGVGTSINTNLVNNTTTAFIGKNNKIETDQDTVVKANASENVETTVARGVGAGTAGIAGSVITTVLGVGTRAYVDAGTSIEAGRDVTVKASDQTNQFAVAGAAVWGGNAGVGAGADVGVIQKDTQAYIANNARNIKAGNNVVVQAVSNEDILSLSAGLAGGGSAGIAGAASVYTLNNNTKGYIGESALISSEGNILVNAKNENIMRLIAGDLAAGGSVGVGGSAGVAVINKTTEAFIGSNANITAKGTKDGVAVDNGQYQVTYVDHNNEGGNIARPQYNYKEISDGKIDNQSLTKDRKAEAIKQKVTGMAVTAVSKDHLETSSAGGAVGGSAGVGGSATTNVITNNTKAYIADNSKINQAKSLLVAAGTDYYRLGISGVLSGSGTASVGAGTDIAIISNNTQAYLGKNTLVNLEKDMDILANASEDILSIAVGGAGSGVAGIAGSAAVNQLKNQTLAFLDDQAVVKAGGNTRLLAQDKSTLNTVAGALGLGFGVAGVGGSFHINTINKDTQSYLGDETKVESAQELSLQAQSEENVLRIVASGGAGLYAGVAGAVGINNLNSTTAATIKEKAKVNSQTAKIKSDNKVALTSITGSAAAGIVGAAGGVDIGTVKNKTTASVQDGAEVKSSDDFTLYANSKQNLKSYAFSAAGGVIGIGGGLSIYSLGTNLNLDSRKINNQEAVTILNGNDSSGKEINVQSYLDGQIQNNGQGSLLTNHLLGGYQDQNIKQAKTALDSQTAQLSTIELLNKQDNLGGTTAYLGNNNKITAKNIQLNAKEELKLLQNTGAGAIGGGAFGAGVSLAVLGNDTGAIINQNVVLNAQENIFLNAELQEDISEKSLAAAIGATLSVGAAVTSIQDDSKVEASIGDGSKVEQAKKVEIKTRYTPKINNQTIGAGVGLGTALGAAIADVQVQGKIKTSLGNNVQIGQAGKAVEDLSLTGETDITNIVDVQGGSIGSAAATGTYAGAFINPESNVKVGDNSQIKVRNNLFLFSKSQGDAKATATGASLGGLAVGLSFAKAELKPTNKLVIGNNTALESVQGDINIIAYHNQELNKKANAKATTAMGSLVGVAGSKADADSSSTLETIIGGAMLMAKGDVKINSQVNNSSQANSKGVNIAGAVKGTSIAKAISNGQTKTDIRSKNIRAQNLTIQANGLDQTFAETISGTGAVGAVIAAEANTENKGKTRVSLASEDAKITNKLNLSSLHTANFNTHVDSMKASLVGYSGAFAKNIVDNQIEVQVANNSQIEAGEIALEGKNNIEKNWLSDDNFNVKSGSGGAWDLAAGKSETNIDTNTIINIGDKAKIRQKDNSSGKIKVEAYNQIKAYDKTKLDAGGAIEIAKIESIIDNKTNNALLQVGQDANLTSAGDIEFLAHTTADLQTSANAKTYGIAGSAKGKSQSSSVVKNEVNIGEKAVLEAKGQLKLQAGSNKDNLNLQANTDLYNKTAIPIKTKPEANALLKQNNQINLATGSIIKTAGDIYLLTEKGNRNLQGEGIGKDLYQKYLEEIGNWFTGLFGAAPISLKIKGGKEEDKSTTSLRLDGTVQVGTENRKYLFIKEDGTRDALRSSPEISFIRKEKGSISETEMKSITEPLKEIENQLKIVADDLVKNPNNPSLRDLKNQLEAKKIELQKKKDNLEKRANTPRLQIDQEISAYSGNIDLITDYVTGSGKLIAPTDSLIQVENKSDLALVTNKMTIPDFSPGRVYLNQVLIPNTQEIKQRSSFTGTIEHGNKGPSISVQNTKISSAGSGADIYVDGDINNLNGEINIQTRGNVEINAKQILADTIRMNAGGDIKMGYVNGFRSIKGDPYMLYKEAFKSLRPGFFFDKSGSMRPVKKGDYWEGADIAGYYDRSTPVYVVDRNQFVNSTPSILAGNNVFISGEYLDINGIVQSGIPKYEFTVTQNMREKIAAHLKSGSKDRLQLSGLDAQGNLQIDQMLVYFNPQNKSLEVEPVSIKGGYMELYGHILNSAVGELRVMDGYGTIKIDNPTEYRLVVKDLNTGSGVKGTLKITDTAKINLNGDKLVTTMERIGDKVKTSSAYVKDGNIYDVNIQTVNGRNTDYQPLSGQYWAEDKKIVNAYSDSTYLKNGYRVGDEVVTYGPYIINTNTYGNLGSNGFIQTRYKHLTTFDHSSKNDREVWWPDGRYTDMIYASNPIAVNFIGQDKGSLEIYSDGGVTIDGILKNNLGETKIAVLKGIQQGDNPAARIVGQEISLFAQHDCSDIGFIGDPAKNTIDKPVNVTLVGGDSAYLKEVNGKNIALKVEGDARVKSIQSVVTGGKVLLAAGGSIIPLDNNAGPCYPLPQIKADFITISSENGSIGKNFNSPYGWTPVPLALGSVSGTQYVNARAGKDIDLYIPNGDLMVNKVESLTGNVRVKLDKGSILDNNSVEVESQRTKEQLEKLWDDMDLIGDDARKGAENTIQAYQAMKKQEYETYWQYRNKTEGDVSKLVSEEEKQAYRTTLGWSDEQIQSLEKRLTKEYLEAEQEYGSKPYDKNWIYTMAAEQQKTIRDSAAWTKEELQNSFNSGILKETSDTRIKIEEPNIIGSEIWLTANHEKANIGEKKTALEIELKKADGTTRSWSELTEKERMTFLTAESNDLTMLSKTKINIAGYEDVNIEASKRAYVSAGNSIYLGSEKDLTIWGLTSNRGTGDLRVKTRGNLDVSSIDTQKGNVVLEAAQGDLRAERIRQKEGYLTARAGNNVFLETEENYGGNFLKFDLRLDSVYAVNDVTLKGNNSSILSSGKNKLDIRCRSLRLERNIKKETDYYKPEDGTIGSKDNFLKIGLDPDGILTVNSDNRFVKTDVFINSPLQDLNVGKINVNSGDITFLGGGNIKINPAIIASEAVYTPKGKVTISSANGSIWEGISPAEQATCITASLISLTAPNGSIGKVNQPFRLQAMSTNLQAQAKEGPYIKSIKLDEEDSNEQDFNYLDLVGGVYQLDKYNSDNKNKFVALVDNLDIDNLKDNSDGSMLSLKVHGLKEKMADKVKLHIITDDGAKIEELTAKNASIRVEHDNFHGENMVIGEKADITTNKYRVTINNLFTDLEPSDVQLYTTAGAPIYLYLDGNGKISTNSIVLNCNDNLIINGLNRQKGSVSGLLENILVATDIKGNPLGFSKQNFMGEEDKKVIEEAGKLENKQGEIFLQQ